MKEIILKHLKKYPKMEIVDFVKLVYQSSFGPGHLIKDPNSSLKYLESEYKSVLHNESDVFEDIGNGFVRCNLHSYSGSLERLNEVFVESAIDPSSKVSFFEASLNDLYELSSKGLLSFSVDDLDAYLKEYKKEGYPPVSHSKTFKDLYHPAYRVIKSKYINKLR